MLRWPALALLMLVILTGLTSHASASIRPFKDLSRAELMAVEASEQRLAQLDAALEALERKHQHRQIAIHDYNVIHGDLMAFICAESKFQNAILIRPPGMSEDTRELLTNIARYSVLVPAYLLGVAALCFRGSFSP